MGVVVDLDPLGPGVEPKGLTDLVEDFALGRALGHLAAQRLSRVGVRVVDEGKLFAAPWIGDFHFPVGLHTERRFQQFQLVRPHVGQDQARDRLVLVELAEEGGEDFGVGVGLVDAREIGAAAPVLAAAIEEDLDAGLPPLAEQGEDIGLGDAVGADGVLHRNGRQGADAVADAGGLFIVHGLGRGAHLGGQAGDHGAGFSLQKGRGLLDQNAIVLERDQAGAGGRAAFDLVQHAGPGAGLVDAVGA